MDRKHTLNKWSCFWSAGAVFLFLCIDQLTKWLAAKYLKAQDPFVIIKNVFELHYLENRGAAFGLLQGKRIFFIIMTILVVAAIIWFSFHVPQEKKFRYIRIVAVLYISGALGNFVDRIWHNYVIDFFYFKLIDFPIFNIADIYVVAATAALLLLFIFYYKEEDIERLWPSKKKDKG